MKKYILLLVIQATVINTFCQSNITSTLIRDHARGTVKIIFRIDSLKQAADDGKYERAIRQAGVIGNDLVSAQKIGMGRNSNADGSATPTNYIPVDGYKHTICGPLHKPVHYHDGRIDKDLEIYINVLPTDQHMLDTRFLWNSNFESPWNIVEGEINIHPDQRKYYKSPFTLPVASIASGDNVCVYGAEVMELFDPREVNLTGHNNNHEVHPVDQFWWSPRTAQKNLRRFILSQFVDNSGRFDEKSDYYSIPAEEESWFRPWSMNPGEGVYAIAFEIDPGRKEQISFSIRDEASAGINNPVDDGKRHYLIYQNDTLIDITENTGSNELVSIDFMNVGYRIINPLPVMAWPGSSPVADAYKRDSVIRGFLLLKSTLKGISEYRINNKGVRYLYKNPGMLKLDVTQKKSSPLKQSVKITLEKVKRLHKNSYVGTNPYSDKLINRFFPSTQVPKWFDEQRVDIEFRVSGMRKRYQIGNLNENAEFTFSDNGLVWNGSVVDDYAAWVTCTGSNAMPLGEIHLGGDPLKKQRIVLTTMFPFIIDQEKIEVHLFEFTFLIEPLAAPEKNVNPN